MSPFMSIQKMANGMVLRMMSPSCPSMSQAAVAMAIDCGESNLPPSEPAQLAAASQLVSLPVTPKKVPWFTRPRSLAAVACNLPNRMLALVALPVTKVPIEPISGAKKGKAAPVSSTSPLAMSLVIPVLFISMAIATRQQMVTTVFCRLRVVLASNFIRLPKLMPCISPPMTAPRKIIRPAFDSQPNLKVLPMTGSSNLVTSVLFSSSLTEGTILLLMRMKKIIRPYTLHALRVLTMPNWCFST